MSDAFVDTDVLIRLLTGDDPLKQADSAALFEAVEAGELTVAAPDTVIADAVYVLSSPRLYRVPRPQVEELLAPLIRLPGFRLRNRDSLLRALDLYSTTNLDFGDAMIVASMEAAGVDALYSYDEGFDRLASVKRRAPGDRR